MGGSAKRSRACARSRARAVRRRAMGAAVRAELEAIGLAVTEDDTAAETGAGCGNLLARIPGPPGARTVMLCAHIDTVPLTDGVEVELVDGVYRNRRDAILGADDKAGVAVILEAARRWAARVRHAAASSSSRPARRSGCEARARSTRARSRPSSASCSTTPRRSAAWWWPHRPTTPSMPSSWDAPRTRASGPRTGAARSGPRPRRSSRCGSAGSTRRPRRTWE